MAAILAITVVNTLVTGKRIFPKVGHALACRFQFQCPSKHGIADGAVFSECLQWPPISSSIRLAALPKLPSASYFGRSSPFRRQLAACDSFIWKPAVMA